ncbi:MAG: enoyl-CoA hydratase/isomerase family protein [Sphingobacteriales bacterium]|nr:MAG: enoyl-CoA hydratase/isomerase family protein [Sphingobacteriales bacterium]
MSTHTLSGYVKSETHKGITTIEFFHPQSNSLPSTLLHDLAVAIKHAGDDPNTIVIIIRSAGEKAFCAGASFDELMSITNETEGLKFFSGFAEVINAMRKCPKFIIGRIHGKCVGGGVGLAAAMDYAIAMESAEVKLSELAIAIGPFVVGPAIERKIGKAGFVHLSIDATMWRSSDWARRKGLFAEVHNNYETLDESISRLANTLSHSSPEAMKEMKKVFWQGTEDWDNLLIERAKISGRLVLSEFTRNAINKFKAK